MDFTQQHLANYEITSEEWNLSEQGRRFDRILEVLRAERAQVPWIEFGSMSGGFAMMCAEALGLRRSDIWCCDFTETHLSRARERGFGTARWNLENQPPPAELRSGTFQTVLFCEIVEHLVNPSYTLKPVIDLLAPGGLFLMTTPNLASFGNRVRLLRGQTPSLGPAPGSQSRRPGASRRSIISFAFVSPKNGSVCWRVSTSR